tara:strand:- start:316 stop:1674 length:1359 start_codon:yes stop_codon:yes gene_type:complete
MNGQGRREGYEQSSVGNLLNIIEQISRIGGNVAQTRKDRGQRITDSLQRRMFSIVGENGKKYKRLIDNQDIEPLKAELKAIAPELKDGNLEAIDTYNFLMRDINQQMQDNANYDIDTDFIFNLENELADKAGSYFDAQASTSNMNPFLNDLKESLKIYAKKKGRFINYYPDRTKNDPNLVASMHSVEEMTDWLFKRIDEDGFLSKGELNAYKESLVNGNAEIAEKWDEQVTIGMINQSKIIGQEMEMKLESLRKNQNAYEQMFGLSDNWKKQVQYHNSSDNQSEYKTETFDINRGQAAWEIYKESSIPAVEIADAKNKLGELEKRYLEANPASGGYLGGAIESILGTNVDVNPSVGLRNAVGARVQKAIDSDVGLSQIVKNSGTEVDSFQDLYDVVVKSYNLENSPGKKKATKELWNKLYNEITTMIDNSGETNMTSNAYFEKYGLDINLIK